MADDYDYIVECERFLIRNHKEAYLRELISSNDEPAKQAVWLRLMGLIETWDSTRHRKIHDR
ncbi:hypothetical protein LCGC14_1494160 [marine sediment metagenome]|uniref:Uncharacterized protein n=1 Tax=marine sediment metagenome TaxID=412755 RepID=A0A0F9J5W3_9ZZZZ